MKDSNRSQYHLRLGYADWASAVDGAGTLLRTAFEAQPPGSIDTELGWDHERAELTLKPRLLDVTGAITGDELDLARRRGAGRDRFGNWYWIDESGSGLRVLSAGTQRASDFWPVAAAAADAGTFAPRAPAAACDCAYAGLCVTTGHYLVVGTLAPAGLAVFDLHGGGAPRLVRFPADVPFAPFDLSPTADGGCWALDRVNRRLWRFDRTLAVTRVVPAVPVAVADDFQPTDGSSRTHVAAESIAIHSSDAIALLDADPIAVEGLPDGSVLVCDRRPAAAFSAISRYLAGVRVGAPVALDAVLPFIAEEQRAAFRLVAYDIAFVPEHRAGADGGCASCGGTAGADSGELIRDRIYVVAEDGNQAYAFAPSLAGTQLMLAPDTVFLPMRRFGARALVPAGGLGGVAPRSKSQQPNAAGIMASSPAELGCADAYYDIDERWVPLVEQPRPRYSTQATVILPGTPPGADPTGPAAYDGREPGCVWHRLIIDACLPGETAIAVFSRAADDPGELASLPWQAEPTPYRRGTGSELAWTTLRPGLESFELLFQQARGRHLQLRLDLTGNGRASPRIHALRAWYPRFSYLARYLPAVYRQDATSASFLDRYLANLEGMATGIEDRIALVQVLLDVRSAPAEALDWLASWFDVALDPAWDEPRRRLFIKHAVRFFQMRGTIAGLVAALRLAFDPCVDDGIFADHAACTGDIRIREHFRTRARLAPSPVTPAARWHPALGADELHARWQAAISAPGARFPLSAPASATAAWRAFALAQLGFVPMATAVDAARWQRFLRHRHGGVADFNAAWQRVGVQAITSFAQIAIPGELPEGAALDDWYRFEGLVLAAAVRAHRFSVALPLPLHTSVDQAEVVRRRELAARVIDLEKPAHTAFDIGFYYALLRLGGARLGVDTVLGRGSRELTTPLVLGTSFLAESVLTDPLPGGGRLRLPQPLPPKPCVGGGAS